MEWLDGMNRSIAYIEEHLTGDIDIKQAARLAACSAFHYQRMFTYITDVPLSEYIRRRRMSLAAADLMHSGEKVVDLAQKYGYDSPTAFNRAFQSIHGVSPTKARQEGIRLTAFPPLTFTLSVKGEEAMNYRIETKEAFRIVGYVTGGHMSAEESMVKMPLFWGEVIRAGGIPKLCAIADGKKMQGLLGVCTYAEGEFEEYYIAVPSDAPVPEGMKEYTVPAATYAIFECIGAMPAAIQNVQRRIISEWLPTSGYEYANAPDIELYPDGDQSAADYRCEVWLPVVKKA